MKSSDIDGKVTSTKKKTKGVGGYQELAQSSSSQWHGHRVANAGSATAALKGKCSTKKSSSIQIKVISPRLTGGGRILFYFGLI